MQFKKQNNPRKAKKEKIKKRERETKKDSCLFFNKIYYFYFLIKFIYLREGKRICGGRREV